MCVRGCARVRVLTAVSDQLKKHFKLPSSAELITTLQSVRLTLSEKAVALFLDVGTRLSAFVLQHCCHKLPDLKLQTVRVMTRPALLSFCLSALAGSCKWAGAGRHPESIVPSSSTLSM